MDNILLDQLVATVKKLREEGRSTPEAWGLAWLDQQIKIWPKAWGEDLQAQIYGDLEMRVPVELPDLGIAINADKETPREGASAFVFGAPYAYTAKVRVSRKDKAGLLDAINRLERFLAAWNIVCWGGAIHYWCCFSSRGGSVIRVLDSKQLGQIRKTLSAISRYTEHQQTLIWQAAWWVRQCRRSIFTDPNPSLFGEYLAYWNALECLIHAICDRWPPPKLTEQEKDRRIQEYVAHLGRRLASRDVDKLYNDVVNPGFAQLARHALSVCFGVVGDQYNTECFKKRPKQSRLYQVRNDIAHGNIVEYDLETRLRVEAALNRLDIIVINMLAFLTQQAIALDSEVSSCYTCVNLSSDEICLFSLTEKQ